MLLAVAAAAGCGGGEDGPVATAGSADPTAGTRPGSSVSPTASAAADADATVIALVNDAGVFSFEPGAASSPQALTFTGVQAGLEFNRDTISDPVWSTGGRFLTFTVDGGDFDSTAIVYERTTKRTRTLACAQSQCDRAGFVGETAVAFNEENGQLFILPPDTGQVSMVSAGLDPEDSAGNLEISDAGIFIDEVSPSKLLSVSGASVDLPDVEGLMLADGKAILLRELDGRTETLIADPSNVAGATRPLELPPVAAGNKWYLEFVTDVGSRGRTAFGAQVNAGCDELSNASDGGAETLGQNCGGGQRFLFTLEGDAWKAAGYNESTVDGLSLNCGPSFTERDEALYYKDQLLSDDDNTDSACARP